MIIILFTLLFTSCSESNEGKDSTNIGDSHKEKTELLTDVIENLPTNFPTDNTDSNPDITKEDTLESIENIVNNDENTAINDDNPNADYIQFDKRLRDDEPLFKHYFTSNEVNDSFPDDIAEKISELDTDFKKIKWIKYYSPCELYPEFVVSVAIYNDYYVLVGFTNLGNRLISFSGDLDFKLENSTYLSGNRVYYTDLGKNMTHVESYACHGGQNPTGDIEWQSLEIQDSYEYKEIPIWEGDWELTEDSSNTISVIYKIKFDRKASGLVSVVLLDKDSEIIGAVGGHYNPEGAEIEGSTYTGLDASKYKVDDVAMFVDAYYVRENN